MKWHTHSVWGRVFRIVAVAVAAGALWAAGTADTTTVLEDLRLPFEYYEDGRVKVQLIAGVALIPADGPVQASEVRLEFYTSDGRLESVLSLDSCEFDRGAGVIRSDGRVRFARTGLTIAGKGCVLAAEKETVRLLSDVRVVLSYDASQSGFSKLGLPSVDPSATGGGRRP